MTGEASLGHYIERVECKQRISEEKAWRVNNGGETIFTTSWFGRCGDGFFAIGEEIWLSVARMIFFIFVIEWRRSTHSHVTQHNARPCTVNNNKNSLL